MSWTLHVLGVGNAAAAPVLGSAAAVIVEGDRPLLMIDCGHEALGAYVDAYGSIPEALFITHAHMDHIAGLERLFYAHYFGEKCHRPLRIYVPAPVVPILHARLAEYPGVLAEGGANFWDAFQLVPVTSGFWHQQRHYEVFPVRHHLPDSAFGLRLRGSLVWTGDTRPIPEMLARFADANELIAHDCDLHGNPSHAGLDDLEAEYPRELLSRCLFYHYSSAAAGEAMRARGYRVARQGERLALAEPSAASAASF